LLKPLPRAYMACTHSVWAGFFNRSTLFP
jgi:hypothetical protein